MKEFFFSQTTERVTSGVAIGATVSPFWLQHISDTASVLLPILGALWLVIQIVGYFMKNDKEDKE